MLLQIGKLLGKGYLLLLAVAAGGLVGAQISGFLPAIIEFASSAQRARDPGFVRSWMHGGWLVGAVLFLTGAMGRTLRSMRKDVRVMKQLAELRRSSRHTPGRPERKGFGVSIGSQRCGIPGSLGIGGLVGGFLGLIVGGSFLLLWFSLTYSPLGPDGWASSVSVEKIGMETHKDRALTTDHPVAFYAFGLPIVLGTIVGALVAGLGTAIENWKTREPHGVAGMS